MCEVAEASVSGFKGTAGACGLVRVLVDERWVLLGDSVSLQWAPLHGGVVGNEAIERPAQPGGGGGAGGEWTPCRR